MGFLKCVNGTGQLLTGNNEEGEEGGCLKLLLLTVTVMKIMVMKFHDCKEHKISQRLAHICHGYYICSDVAGL